MRKTFIKVAVFSFLCMAFAVANAQEFVLTGGGQKRKTFEIGLSGGLSQYRGEWNGYKSALQNFDYNPAYGIAFKYNIISDYIQGSFARITDKRLSFEATLTHMSVSSNKNDFKDVYSAGIWEVALKAQMNLLKYTSLARTENNVFNWTPYGCIGIAGYTSSSTVTLAGVDSDKSATGIAMILGIGGKIALARGISLEGEIALRFTPTDELDQRITEGTPYDRYYFGGAKIMINLDKFFKN